MQCEECREQIHKLLDNPLSPEEIEAIEYHCMTCPRCSAILHRYSALQILVQKHGSVEPPTELYDKIMRSVQQEKKKRQFFSRSWIAAAAAVFLIIGSAAAVKYFSDADNASKDSFQMGGTIEILSYDTLASTEAATLATTVTPVTTAAPVTSVTSAASTTESIAVTTAADTTVDVYATSLLPHAWVVEEEYSETLDDKMLEATQEQLSEWTNRELLCAESVAFVEVVHLEMIPQAVDWIDHFQTELGVEDVSVLACRMTRAEIESLLEDDFPDWSYKTNDPEYFQDLKLDITLEQGLLLIVIPAGA